MLVVMLVVPCDSVVLMLGRAELLTRMGGDLSNIIPTPSACFCLSSAHTGSALIVELRWSSVVRGPVLTRLTKTFWENEVCSAYTSLPNVVKGSWNKEHLGRVQLLRLKVGLWA